MQIFHEAGWLAAVSGRAADRVEIADKDGRIVGFLPYVVKSIYGVKVSNMAPFTHVLGPVVELGGGSPITRMHNRFKMTSELLEKLPSLAIFRQALDCTVPDALAFQAAGFRVSAHYPIRVDCADIGAVWKGLSQKPRRCIRPAEERDDI